MKILVLSDSHGDIAAMERAVKQYEPDCILHLGDHYRDARRLERSLVTKLVHCVPGNCDPGTDAPDTLQFSLGGVRFFITHGHRYSVKFSPLRAVLAAREAEADILCFGHTHRQLYSIEQGLHVLNPGACSGAVPKCAVLTIENGAVSCALCKIGGEDQ